MKGLILAGGLGTRLYPLTRVASKQLLPVYDKPMIYYPLANLMQAGIRDIMIITSTQDRGRFEELLGDGSDYGISLSYREQPTPDGIAHAFVIAEDFIGDDCVALILGDNIFYGPDIDALLQEAAQLAQGGLVFGYQVHDPCRYGVLAFDEAQNVIDIVEKPKKAPSSYAVTGLYFYDNRVIEVAKSLKPSWRGEYEITDINRAYLQNRELQVKLFGRGFAWLDTGTHETLHKAATFVQTIQERQGIKIACIEEIAFEKGWISYETLKQLSHKYASSEYGSYLVALCEQVKDRAFRALL